MPQYAHPRTSAAFARLPRATSRDAVLERCDLCSQALGAAHDHVLERSTRRLTCVCPTCAVLFEHDPKGRFKRVLHTVRRLDGFRLSRSQWERLQVPMDLAFFFRSSTEGRAIAWYPSPAGATESPLSADAWDDLERVNPALAKMASDVEALLVNRVGSGRGSDPEYFIASADECYRLVGLIRSHWHGLSGGAEVWRAIATFFDDLRNRAALGVTHA